MATGGAIKAGEAFIELSLRGARGFGQRLTSVIRSMARLAATAAKVGVAMAAAFGSAALVGIRQFVRLGDQMQKMAQRTGASAETLSQLGFAAEQSGSNIETVERGLRGMARAIRGFERELSTQVEAFEALGITFAEISDLSPGEQFERIAEALSNVENPTRRAAIAMEIFGRAGTELLPLFAGGAEGVRQLREQADILGRTVSQEQANRAAALADRWNEVRSVFRGFVFDIVDNFAPALESMLTSMRNFLLDWKIWVVDLQLAFEEVMSGVANKFEEVLNTFDLGLAGLPILGNLYQGGQLGTNFAGGTNARLSQLRRQRQELITQGRPSAAFSPTMRKATAYSIAEGIQEAQRRAIGGATIGSFAGDVRQFGIQSVGRRQLRVLQQIENIQERQLQILEQTGFLAFL